MKEFKVYKTRVANEMLRRGYNLIRFEENTKRPSMTVFVFEKVDGIFEVHDEIKQLLWENN